MGHAGRLVHGASLDGHPVRIDGHAADADGEAEVHGRTGKIVGHNHTQVGADGVQRTTVKLDTGEVVAVPSKMLRSK